jgi:cytochrome c biogenesis factor
MLRIAYVSEFLLALLAITVVWGQVGGQDHLDLMPWYDKLVLTFALALVTVLGTVASVSREKAWNGTAIVCLVIAILIACAMGAVTYYYHVHEDDESGALNSAAVAKGCRHTSPGQCT